MRGLRRTVRGCPLPSAVGRGDCHSLRHSVAVWAADGCRPGALGLRITRRIRDVQCRPPGHSCPARLASRSDRVQSHPGLVLANPLARQASLAVIEVTDGSRLTLGPGDLLRAEDTDGTGNKL